MDEPMKAGMEDEMKTDMVKLIKVTKNRSVEV